MRRHHEKQRGAALVIALGFLAALTILAFGFAVRARAERLAGRDYLESARAQHLLHSALARAMEDIDAAFGTAPPNRAALGSIGHTGFPLQGSLDLSVERDYLPLGAPDLAQAFEAALAEANWEQIAVNGTNIGAIAYVVLNTTGLLDANSVGGSPRGPGRSPREIQLSPELLPELGAAPSLVNPDGTLTPTNAPGAAFALNRDAAWKAFDTLRDIKTLNTAALGGAIDHDIASFQTHSFSPRQHDTRSFMGTNTATLATGLIRAELERLDHVDAPFVMNQLRDYLDADSLPQDEHGNYTDLSVEAVPMINEIILTCDLRFTPILEPINQPDGSAAFEVVSVLISNAFSMAVELWRPFPESDSSAPHRLELPAPPLLDATLFGPAAAWVGATNLTLGATTPRAFELHRGATLHEASSPAALANLLEHADPWIQLPTLHCATEDGELVDRVRGARLDWHAAVAASLRPTPLAEELFDANRARPTTRQLVLGTACVDPRLNWDGTNTNQWKSETSGATPNAINSPQLSGIDTPDPIGRLHVRDDDQIDSPWELTYLLPHPERPWRTFQFLDTNDSLGAGQLLDELSTLPNGPPPHGQVNPHGKRLNALASVFLDMPTSPFAGAAAPRRMDAASATAAASLLANHLATHPSWPADPTADFDLEPLAEVLGDTHPWALEAFFRNSVELFDPRDTSFAILLAARVGADWNGNGIDAAEVRATQQAVAYVWRDRASGQAAITFFGLTDSLRSTIGAGQSWGELLQAFNPN